MALTVSFSYSQNYGSITLATFTDTSTGVDGTITSRRIYLKKADNTYLVPAGNTTDYIIWPYANLSIAINALNKDYALEVTVLWMAGSSATYTSVAICLFRAYSELFLRQLTQSQAGRPNLLNNSNYWANKCKLRTLVDDAIQGVAVINDQTISQLALDEAKKLTDNTSNFI